MFRQDFIGESGGWLLRHGYKRVGAESGGVKGQGGGEEEEEHRHGGECSWLFRFVEMMERLSHFDGSPATKAWVRLTSA
jgi:hypothetical protein